MTAAQPVTMDQVLEIIREDSRQAEIRFNQRFEKLFAEQREAEAKRLASEERRRKANEESERKLRKSMAHLSDRLGDIIVAMVEGNIVGKFRKLGYKFTQCARNVDFENHKLALSGEIDLFLEDGDIALLIEVKTKLETADVKQHIQRMEKYRRYADAKGDKRRFIAAVAGAVVTKDAMSFAHEQGLYVIKQSGAAVRIMPSPQDFQRKIWNPASEQSPA